MQSSFSLQAEAKQRSERPSSAHLYGSSDGWPSPRTGCPAAKRKRPSASTRWSAALTKSIALTAKRGWWYYEAAGGTVALVPQLKVRRRRPPRDRHRHPRPRHHPPNRA